MRNLRIGYEGRAVVFVFRILVSSIELVVLCERKVVKEHLLAVHLSHDGLAPLKMSSSQKNRGAERWTETNLCESRGFDLQDKIVHSQQRHDRNLRITEIIPESSTRYLFYLTDSRSSGVVFHSKEFRCP